MNPLDSDTELERPPAAASERAPKVSHEPAVELSDVGLWYRMHRSSQGRLRDLIFSGQWRRPAAPVLWALRGISLSCAEGTVLGIVGHNGSGKSTLCLVLSGILTPDEGTATVRGKVSALLTLGTGFNGELTGRENIMLNAAFLGIPRATIRSKIDEIVDFSELGEFIDQPVRTYSSGMSARLGFSIAVSIEPDIIIIDEVLSVGDAHFQRKSRQRMDELMNRSRMIVLVSHNTSFLKSMCTHVLWLERGTMRAFGDAKPILDEYQRVMTSR